MPAGVPIPLRRVLYRIAYRLLVLSWLLRRAQTQGVKFLLTDVDRVLLVRHSYGSRRWDVPGGGLHRDEIPLRTAQREVREELGLEDLDFTYVGSLRTLLDHRTDIVYCFHAEVSAPVLTPDLGELEAIAWFARDQLPQPRAALVDAILRLTRPAHAPRTAGG